MQAALQATPQAAAGWLKVEELVDERFQLTMAGILGCASPKARKFEWHRVYCIVASGSLRWSVREGGTPAYSVPCSLYSVRVDARHSPRCVELTVLDFDSSARSVIRLQADSAAKASRWADVIRANGAVRDDIDEATVVAPPAASLSKSKEPAAMAHSQGGAVPLVKPEPSRRQKAGDACPEDEDPREGASSLADTAALRPDTEVASVTSTATEAAAASAESPTFDGVRPDSSATSSRAAAGPEAVCATDQAASGLASTVVGRQSQLGHGDRMPLERLSSDPSLLLPAGLQSPWASNSSAAEREGDLDAVWSASEAEAATAESLPVRNQPADQEQTDAASASCSADSDPALPMDRMCMRGEAPLAVDARSLAATTFSEHLPGHLRVDAASSSSLPPALFAECAAALGLAADSGWDLTGLLVAMPGSWDPALSMGRWFVRRALTLTVTGPCVGLMVGPATAAPGGGDAEGCGAVVSSISAASPLHGALLPGDRLVAVAGSALLTTPWEQVCRRFEAAVAVASAAAPVTIVVQTSTRGKAIALRRARSGAFLAPAQTPRPPSAPRSGRLLVDGGIVMAQPPSPSGVSSAPQHRPGSSSGFLAAAAADTTRDLPIQERRSRADDDGDSVGSVELDEASHGGLPAAWFSPRLERRAPATPKAGSTPPTLPARDRDGSPGETGSDGTSGPSDDGASLSGAAGRDRADQSAQQLTFDAASPIASATARQTASGSLVEVVVRERPLGVVMDGIQVCGVVKGSPLRGTGLVKAGDTLVRVDSHDLARLSAEEARRTLAEAVAGVGRPAAGGTTSQARLWFHRRG